MEEIISMIVANGLWAALFCVLLGYELKDSRKRESRYCEAISALTDRLHELNAVKADTEVLIADAERLIAETDGIRSALSRRARKGKQKDEQVCAAAT